MNAELFPELPRNKTRLDIFKEQHAIDTNGNGEDSDGKWIAGCIPEIRKMLGGYVQDGDENKDLMMLIINFGRLIDEAEMLGCGPTEEDACLDLARKLNLKLTL